MVDNLNKVVPSIPIADRVKRVERKRGSSDQTPFEDALKDKEKKKKKKKFSEREAIPAGGHAASKNMKGFRAVRQGDKKKREIGASNTRIIDIRV